MKQKYLHYTRKSNIRENYTPGDNISCRTEALICPKGYICGTNGLNTPIECPAGSYCPTQGLITAIICPAGSYCPKRSINPIICPAGSYCPIGSSNPIQCKSGSFCPEGSSVETICPPGYYCTTSTKTICPAGSYCPENSGNPTTCPAGSYCPTDGLSTPTTCPAGSYCPTTGLTLATTCPAGSYCPTTGLTLATTCPAGSYCPTDGLSTPTTCPAGSYCPTTGLTSSTTCPLGSYCPITGLIMPQDCPAGSYCPSVTTLSTCPKGFFCPSSCSNVIPGGTTSYTTIRNIGPISGINTKNLTIYPVDFGTVTIKSIKVEFVSLSTSGDIYSLSQSLANIYVNNQKQGRVEILPSSKVKAYTYAVTDKIDSNYPNQTYTNTTVTCPVNIPNITTDTPLRIDIIFGTNLFTFNVTDIIVTTTYDLPVQTIS